MKTVKRTLRISSKEIAQFLSQTLTETDIRWAVIGYKNQKKDDICPMCGQTISDKRAVQLFKKLGKYVSQHKDDNAREYCTKLNMLAGRLKMLNLSKRVEVFNQIVQLLSADSLLLKKDTERLQKGLLWNEQKETILEGVINKIYSKVENPYKQILLSEEEEQCISLINQVIRNIHILENVISQAKERLEKKIDRRISMSDMSILFEVSYGPNRIVAERIKENAGVYIRNQRKIEELNEQIDDCYNQIQLDEINEYFVQVEYSYKFRGASK